MMAVRQTESPTSMTQIVIYTAMLCPYCASAKTLLRQKNVSFDEIDVSFKPTLREEMRTRAGGRNTVPQIFIGETHVGGCDDLYALDADGKLDPLLAGA